jgi:hypothetical protein
MTHPITPSPELLKQWEDDWFDERQNVDVLLIQAFQTGADQELEACIAWFDTYIPGYELVADRLRAARRPKPMSLKEQALALIDGCNDPDNDYLDDDALATIRRALEALPE